MIDQDRNLGVTEARFGLTLLICLLAAVGFVVLMRLGGASDPTADIGPEDEASQGLTHIEPVPEKVEQQPQVLPIEPQEVRSARIPERPKKAHGDESRVPSIFPVLPASTTDEPSFESQIR